MAQTLLQIVTQTCDELGITRPGSAGVFASQLPQDRQMLALLQSAGKDCMHAHQWQDLIATASVVTATATQTYSLPSDFDRLVDDTGWNLSNHFPMLGSVSPQRTQFWRSSSVVAPATRKEFRITVTPNGTSQVFIVPNPTAAETLTFLYVSSNWVTSGATNVSAFQADSDTSLFPSILLIKDLKWRFRAAKGLDASDYYNEWRKLYDQMVARDLGTPTIDQAGPVGPAPYDWVNIPDGNWSIT